MNIDQATAAPNLPPCAFCGSTAPGSAAWCHLFGLGDRRKRIPVCRECFSTLNGPDVAGDAGSPTMDQAEMRRETRRQKALDRLGTDYPRCRACQEDDPCCLELHHLEGKDFGATMVILCRNCHRKLSDPQKDHPPRFGEPPANQESIAHFLIGLADLLTLLAMKLKEFGEYLIDEVRSATSTEGE